MANRVRALRRDRAAPALGAVAVTGLLACAWGFPASASAMPAGPAAGAGLHARTVLDGARLGVTEPDDLTRLGDQLFVAFQNGVPSTGGSPGTARRSTVVQFTADGSVVHRWELTGKCDGLTADPTGQRLIATVNEDGNSSLYTIAVGDGALQHYRYDADPLPHGGGTDSVTVDHGQILIVASAPTAGTFGPAMYRVTLTAGTAHLAAAPFYDASTASVANTGSHGVTVQLALTDPDSSTVVPASSPRFGGDLEITAQGDQQQIYAHGLGTDRQRLQVLNLSQSVDDTAFASSAAGTLLATDATHNTVIAVSGPLDRGAAYTAVTPGNANTPPPQPVPNSLGRIDLTTGTVTLIATHGAPLEPKGLLYLPRHDQPGT